MTGQLPIPGLEAEPEITSTVTSEVFDWFENEEDVIVERQPALAVYRNRRNHVVIRAEGASDDVGACIFIATEPALRRSILAQRACASVARAFPAVRVPNWQRVAMFTKAWTIAFSSVKITES